MHARKHTHTHPVKVHKNHPNL